MNRFSLRSLLAMASLAVTALPIAGQTEAQLRELLAKEAQARQKIEEFMVQVHEAHREAAYRSQDALQLAEEEARMYQGQRALERERALRLVQEQERAVRERVVGIREGELDRIRERARDLQQVMFRARAGVRLGVSLDPRQGRDYDAQGVLLQGVSDGSPAEDAGLQEGDMVTHVNGHSLLDPIPDEEEEEFDDYESLPVQRLMALAREFEDGEEIEVRYLRDGAQASTTVVAEDRGAWRENWVSVIPRTTRGRVLYFGPEGSRTIRLHIPDEKDLHLEILPHLEELKEQIHDLEIDLSDFEMDDLDVGRAYFDQGRDWSIRTNPRFRFRSPGTAFYQGVEGDHFIIRRGDTEGTWSFSSARGYGLELRDLNPDLGSYFSADTGVLVMNVDEDSPLELRAGDVILRIGERDVADIRGFYRILGSYEEDEAVTLTILRQGQEMRVGGTAH